MEKDKVIYLNELTVDDIDELSDRIDRRIERIENIVINNADRSKLLKLVYILMKLFRFKAHLFQSYSNHISKQAISKRPSGGSIQTSGYVNNQSTTEYLKKLRGDI